MNTAKRPDTRPVLYVTPGVDWHGKSGFGYDGWTGETPEEAVLESFLQEGVEIGAAMDKLGTFRIEIQE